MKRSFLVAAALAGAGLASGALLAYRSAGKTQNCCQSGLCPAGQTCNTSTCTCQSTGCSGNCISDSQCGPGCTCQFGVCLPPTGTCTTNADCGFPDSGKECVNGVCVSCGSMNCPCGTQCYPTATECCQCNPLVPQQIIGPVIVDAYPTWAARYGCLSGSFEWGSIPQMVTCTSYPPVGSAIVNIPVSFQLVDASGLPICNQEIALSLNDLSTSWISNDGHWVGDFLFQVGQSVITDENGMADVNVGVALSVNESQTAANIASCMFCCGIGGGSTSLQTQESIFLTATLSSNPTIRAYATLRLNTFSCFFYNGLG